MVIRDFYQDDSDQFASKNVFEKRQIHLAHPIDRLAALILDLGVIFIPLFTLISAPIKRQMIESTLVNDWESVISLGAKAFIAVLFVYLIVHVFSHLFFGTTFGKKIMGLQVVDIWSGSRPSLWNYFLRSFYLFFQFLGLGLPLVLALTNKKNRALHDQLTDTLVISTRPASAKEFSWWPLKAVVRLAGVGLIAIAIPSFLKVVATAAGTVDMSAIIFPNENNSTLNCGPAESLHEAMSLVASGYMETSCLKEYADLEFVDGASPSGLGYLAKSFLYVENQALSDRYLEKVCEVEPSSASCTLAEFISYWSDGDLESLERILERGKELNEPYLSLWAIRYFQQAGNFQKALEYSKGLDENPKYGIYVKTQNLKANYFLGFTEKSDHELLEMTRDSNSPVVLDTMAWACLKKISQGCEESAHLFCDKTVTRSKSVFSHQPRVALANLRVKECRGEPVDSGDYLTSSSSEAWKEFLYAYRKELKEDLKSAWSLYAQLAKSEDAPNYLKAEAIRRMSLNPELAKVEDLENLIEKIDSFEERREAAKYVAEIYFKLDFVAEADSLLKEYKLEMPLKDHSRLPASEVEE